jgi:DNA-binding CsgD family transcriptional regulator
MREHDARLDVLGLVYEAALDQSLWPKVLDQIADLAEASVGQIGSFDAYTLKEKNIAPRLSPDVLSNYTQNWANKNPFLEKTVIFPAGNVFAFDDVLPNSGLKKTEIYHEFFQPNGLEESLGVVLTQDSTFAAMLAVYRTSAKGAFDRPQADVIAWFTPHLRRAVKINARLGESAVTRAASATMFDQVGQPSILVDAASRVRFANRAAEDILAEGAGLMRDAAGALRATRHSETVALHALIAKAAIAWAEGRDDPSGHLRLSRGPARAPLTATVIPLRADTQWLSPRFPTAMLFVTDPERAGGPTAASLQQGFGLTRSEAAVALEILNGGGLTTAATRLGIARTTARTHLSAVFDKTGTRRQADLVHVLLRGAGAIHPR